MKNLFIKIAVLLLPFILFAFIPFRQDGELLFEDKVKMLDTIKTEKIVIIGGSNATIGINSAEMSKALNMPVRNLGLAGSTVARTIDISAKGLYKGDIALFSLPYVTFTGSWNGDANTWHTILDLKQYNLLYKRGHYGIPAGFLSYVKQKIINVFKFLTQKKRVQANAEHTNEYGDDIGYYKVMSAIPNFGSWGNIGALNKTYITYFFNIVEDLNKKGVKVLISYPCYEEGSFNASKDAIYELDKIFRANKNLQVISKPEDYSFPHNYYYDMPYHPNSAGRELCTERLIKDLRAAGL